MRPTDWLPPVLWMGVIVGLSTDTASAEHTGRLLLPVLRWLLPWATPGQVDTIHGLVRNGATPILLWLAAVGGAIVIAINAWAGVPSGLLWITTPAAGLMLLARARLRRRKPGAGESGNGRRRGALRDP